MPSRLRTTMPVLSVLLAAGIALAACSSSNNNTTSSTPASTAAPAVSLQSLENWPTTAVSLQETGSSLLYPLFNFWVAQIQKQWPSVSLTTASTGSGTGISDATNGTVQIGASDAYLSNAQVSAAPGLEDIPLAISAQMINYNLPGLSGHLKLSGPVLSAIYQGTVKAWNDPKIAALNPGVNLPSTPIITVHRSDGSGDTFLFSTLLSDTDPNGWGKTISFGTTVPFPNVPGALAAQGNGGMVQTCQNNPGCIAYIGISFLSKTNAAGLGEAEVQNAAGNFELPSQTTIADAASSFATTTPASGAVSMIYGPGTNSYPIINYEYAIVNSKQSSALDAQAVKAVLAWAVDSNGGNAPSFLDQVGFVALPSSVVPIATALIAKIGS